MPMNYNRFLRITPLLQDGGVIVCSPTLERLAGRFLPRHCDLALSAGQTRRSSWVLERLSGVGTTPQVFGAMVERQPPYGHGRRGDAQSCRHQSATRRTLSAILADLHRKDRAPS